MVSNAFAVNDLLSGLNENQKEAVAAGWGASLVVAGAGSGKTLVLTKRVAHLVLNLNQDPYSVLAVTFTNKAAAEMKQRLEKIVGSDLARMLSIGTFHSTCARFLRKEIEAYKSQEGFTWGKNFTIYDETDSLNVVKSSITRLNLDEKAFPAREMLSKISSLKNEGYTNEKYSQDARSYKETRIAQIYSSYQAELAKNNALDFDDLIVLFVDLLKQNPEIRSQYSERFRHVLVDEFQDTNSAQYELVKLLTGNYQESQDWRERSLMVVGDVDQSIYSWRQADFRIILGFQNDFKDAKLIKLEENYRSTKIILDVANNIIVNNSERIEKVLRSNRGQGEKVKCFNTIDEIDEAYCVVEELKRLKQKDISLSDCVCLYRTNAQSRALEEILVRNNVAYTMVGSTRFYDRREIKDVLAYLKLSFNVNDGQSFMRVVNTPRRGIGKTSLDALAQYAFEQGISLSAASENATQINGLTAKSRQALISFAQNIRQWHFLSNQLPPSQLMEIILKQTKYMETLQEEANESNDPQVYSRIENIKELQVVAIEFEATADEPNLESFLTRISLVSDLDLAKLDADAVKLMTLHSAKGLEFPVVFLMGLEEGVFPHVRSLNSPTQLEEERRLMYVGITRAQDLLYFSYARKRMIFGAGKSITSNYTIASRFLNEISPDLLVGYYPGNQYQESSGIKPRSDYQRDGYRDDYLEYNQEEKHRETKYKDDKFKKSDLSQGSSWRRHVTKDAFDNTRQREIEIESKVKNWQKLEVGDTVSHSKFGIGKVIQVIGDQDKELYNVDFQNAGKRLLDPRFAKLMKINS